MRNLTSRKISILILLTILLGTKANAQINYTDINPDVVTTGAYNLDINNDGITDFEIVQTTSTVTGLKCTGTKINRYLRLQAVTGNAILPGNFFSNTLVDQSSVTWSTIATFASVTNLCTTGGCGTSPICFPSWHLYYSTAVTGKYIGLKFLSGAFTYYGWLRFSSTSSPLSCTLMDYGYNTIPGERILTGQATTADYIVVSPIIRSLCAGGNVSVPFTVSGTFNSNNIVTAELSDAAGSYATALNIGSTVTNVSGIINAVIPAGIVAGTGYRIRVTTSNPAKLSSDITTTSNNGISLIVNTSIPTGLITASGSTNLCDGNVAMSTSTAAGNSYQWKLNGITIPGAISYSYTAIASGDYTCEKTNGCGSINSNIITVTSIPVSAVINSTGTTTTCGTNVSLSATNRTGNSYQWKLDGTAIAGATLSSYSAPLSGNYSCTITNGCGSVISNTITVTVNPLPPAVTVTASPAVVVCAGPVSLISNAASGLSFEWHNSAGIIPGEVLSSYSAAATGAYYLKVINTYLCSRVSNSISLLIGPPVATVSPSSGSICRGSSVQLYAYPSGISYSYQWMKNGVNIPGAITQSYAVDKAGTYSAKVTIASGGCNATSPGVPISHGCRLASVVEADNTPEFLVAPNPSSEQFTIRYRLSEGSQISLKVFDLTGRLIEVLAEGIATPGENEMEWNVSQANAGIYFLRIESVDFNQTEKLIVTK